MRNISWSNNVSIFIVLVFLGSIYHTVRDILQIVGVESIFTNIGHWNHNWCSAYCDYVTIPVDIFLIISSLVILKRRRFGLLGVFILLAIGIGVILWFWN